MPQLKILHSATGTWHSQINKYFGEKRVREGFQEKVTFKKTLGNHPGEVYVDQVQAEKQRPGGKRMHDTFEELHTIISRIKM